MKETFPLRRVVRFGLAGLINTGITYLIYLMALFMAPYAVAYSIAFVAGIAISYVLNASFVFRERAEWSVGSIYGVIYLVQYGLGLLAVSLLVELVGVDEKLAPLIVIAVIAPLNFLWVQALLAKMSRKRLTQQTIS